MDGTITMRDPETDAGKSYLQKLRDMAEGRSKGNKTKARQALSHFETGFINETMMVVETKRLLRKAGLEKDED